MVDLFEDMFETDMATAPASEGEADDLERIIEHLDSLYETGEDCIHPDTGEIVPDARYDDYRKRLTAIRPDSHIFTDVTASKIQEVASKRVQHNPPMTSISKINGTQEEKEEELKKWMEGAHEGKSSKGYFVMSYKHDGVACALYYEDGKLISAGLRPRDGVNGEDITYNVLHVEGILEKLPEPITCSIRGEIECRISVFNQVNGTKAVDEQQFANPRNFAAGSIRQFKDPRKTRARRLSFTAYAIEALDDAPYKTEIERAAWCKKELGIPFVKTVPLSAAKLASWEEKSGDLDYEVDGIVVSVNNLEEQEQLGRHGDKATGNPKGKIAWKFRDALARVEVKRVRWQVGRTGRLTPVLEFDAVRLEGTNVTQCTAHNLGVVKQHNIGIGSEIEIKKSGKIIPKFERVIKTGDSYRISIADVCPSCSYGLFEEESNDTAELLCNNAECPARNVGTLVHYLSTLGCKGLAESVVKQMIERGMISCASDFYTLTLDYLLDEGFTERTATLTLARIWMLENPEQNKNNNELLLQVDKKNKVSVPIQSFIAALGIVGAGKGTAAALVNHFNGDIEEIRNATSEELKEVEDIGEKTANLLTVYFSENEGEIDNLLSYVELELPKQGKLSGKTFVFTGSPVGGKKQWQDLVASEGGKVGSSVSKKTDYVVVGSDPGAKAKKAEELGIPKIDTDELQDMLQ